MAKRKLGSAGENLIKSYEGYRDTAYKAVPTEKYYTIGWGHYGADVRKGEKITKAQAQKLFEDDISKFVNAVNSLDLDLNQNQFDALVSFCYNCGPGNLFKLVNGKSLSQISKDLLLYNKSGGKVLNGLVKRRRAEKALFDKPVPKPKPAPKPAPKPVSKPKYQLPTSTLKKGSKGKDVILLQKALNAAKFKVGKVDGIYGNKTKDAVERFQKVYLPKEVDGIYGAHVRKALDKVVN